MDEIFETHALNINQVRHIARAMYEVAQVDGIKPEEDFLIRQFYESCREDVLGLTSFEELLAQDFDSRAAAESLSSDELKNMLIRITILLGYADGHLSKKEAEKIQSIAKQLGVPSENVTTMLEEMETQLLGKLAHIRNTEALLLVSKELRDRT